MIRPKEKIESVRDATSCLTWLAGVPKDSEHAIPAFAALLAHLAGKEWAPQVYLEVLETLSPPILAVLKTAGRDLEYRALPLEAAEWTALLGLHALSGALRMAYAGLVFQVSETVLPAKRGVPQSMQAVAPRVLALQRALSIQAQALTFLYRARTTPAPADWEEACRLAEAARDLKCLDVPVPDVAASGKVDTCREAFVAPLLIRLAQPHTLSAAEFAVLRLCARSWAGKVGFRMDSSTTQPQESPGPVLVLGPNDALRLDTQRLLQSVQRRVQALSEGKTPQELGFDAKLSATACQAMLQRLLQLWSKNAETPAAPPAGNGPTVEAFIGMPIHAAQSESSALGFGVSDGPYQYAQRRSDTVTFISSEDDSLIPRVEQLFHQAERWDVRQAQEQGGVFRRLSRQPHVNLGGLIGLRRGEGSAGAAFTLGYIVSLRHCAWEEGAKTYASLHELGVRWFAGRPEPIEMEVTALKNVAAFYLKAPAGLAEVESLVLPLATFKEPARMAILIGGKMRRVQLTGLLMRGWDFDRVSFQFVP